ncbi:hypothetical protein JKG68_25630 [Microvirga aerilata]|uniref:ParA family protein n=1 Tax=Microvirga aerilata TaxID=670292 RepID=A0A937D4A5_9HYPH|nr:hypothetical protein [Microvirga aerilata]MBL0407310.1 hypothetical protein [Microvirga aerilata]
MKKFVVVACRKGGVGKTTVSHSVIDYLDRVEDRPIIFETDTNNPDVGRVYAGKRDMKAFHLSTLDDWGKVIDLVEASNRSIVINTPLGSDVDKNAGALRVVAGLGTHKVRVVMPIDDRQDTFHFVEDMYDALKPQDGEPGVPLLVLRNLQYGEPERFTILNESKLIDEIKASDFAEVDDFPKLPDTIKKQLVDERKTFEEIASSGGSGTKFMIQQFQRRVWAVFEDRLG